MTAPPGGALPLQSELIFLYNLAESWLPGCAALALSASVSLMQASIMGMELWKLEFCQRPCNQVPGEGTGLGIEIGDRKVVSTLRLNLLFHSPGFPIANGFRNGELDLGYQKQQG